MSPTTNVDAGTRSGLEVPIELSTYTPIDDFFGAPFIDCDEVPAGAGRAPLRARRVRGHGHPLHVLLSAPDVYAGGCCSRSRAATPVTRTSTTTPRGADHRRVEMIFRLGGYRRRVEHGPHRRRHRSQGRATTRRSTAGGRPPRSAASPSSSPPRCSARAPAHSYVYGGSGGARRSPLCLAYAPDVWDGALPFMGDAKDGDHGDFAPLARRAGQLRARCSTSSACSVTRCDDVVDAMWPGGSGDPFADLDTHQREELASLYRIGYPARRRVHDRPADGADLAVGVDGRAAVQREDPRTGRAFWTEPGHVGHDQPDRRRSAT